MKVEDKMNFEEMYQRFLDSVEHPVNKNTTDFLGINISADGDEPVMKVYYATRMHRQIKSYPFLAQLKKRDILRDYEVTQDTVSSDYFRVYCGLKNRSNDKMRDFFELLSNESDIFNECKSDIEELTKIRITDMDNYEKYSSLYQVGLKEKNGVIEELKLYFYTKWCKNPNYPFEDSVYKDDFYIQFLKSCTIENYRKLSLLAEKIVSKLNCHMWLVGMDAKKNNYRKNKIYIRKNGVNEEELIKMLSCESEQINKNLEMLKEWRTGHQEYELEGIGLCIDSYNVFSLNFYYCFV